MSKRLHILLVEDSPDDAQLVVQALRRGGLEPDFTRVDSQQALRAALEQQAWDVVISDHRIPGFGGMEALELVRQTGLDVPFIIVSGTIGEDVAVQAMKAGAHDYVMKDQLARLAPAVSRELKEAEGRRARRTAEEERAASLLREREARAAAERAEQQSAFLAEASRVLAQSLALEDTVARVLRLPLPLLADWVLLELEREQNAPWCQVALAHPEKAKEQAARELLERCAAEPALPFGAPLARARALGAVLRAYPALDRVVDGFGVESLLAVPLVARGQQLGTLGLVTSRESGRRLGSDDLPLAQALADRCALALENARLFRQAAEAVHARDVFLSIASHELRTPLTPLQLTVDRMEKRLDEPPAEDDREWLQARLALVRRQSARLSRLVGELLDVSRLASGRLLLQLSEVCLDDVIRGAVSDLEQQGELARSQCPVETRLEAHLVGRWDRLRLEQVVINLLSNAMKYGAGQPVTVTACEQGADAVLTVTDRGIGIAAHDQRRIFERFERAVPEKHYGGLGVGLYIVRQVVQALGGSVAVSSVPGEGSTFTVVLPLGGPAERTSEQGAGDAPAAPAPG